MIRGVGNIFLEFIGSAANSSWVSFTAAALEAWAHLLPLSNTDHDGDGDYDGDDPADNEDDDDLDASLNKVNSSTNFIPVLWYCRLSHPDKEKKINLK